MAGDTIYFNRELSWLKFNERVLQEACDPDMPAFERLKFISIFTSNLDEFYMVRVGSLLDQSLIGDPQPDNKTGMLPREQIAAVNEAVKELYPYRDNIYDDVMQALSGLTMTHVGMSAVDGGIRRIVKEYFETEILPLLSPQIVDQRHPFPRLENRQLYIGVRLKKKGSGLYGLIPLPREINRICPLPDGRRFLLAEEIVQRFAEVVFGGYDIEAKGIFRVTRSADLEIKESLFDEDLDYRSYMREILKKRGRLSPVRLETNTRADRQLTDFFLSRLGLGRDQCFSCESPIDMGFVSRLEDYFEQKDRERLTYSPLRPQWPAGLAHGPILPQVEKGDLLLSYPYESMKPLVDLLREAAEDPKVISIRMTLYRIGSQSQIIQCLCAAAENGKEVTAVVELRARFDEQSNINWSSVLEESGCRVIYGIHDYKVHGKILLITRRMPHGPQYITDIATGNYNEETARQYTDLSLLTADREIGEDAAEFFHNVSIGNTHGRYRRLLVAPSSLKTGLLALIDGERGKAAAGKPAEIVAKLNSLTDKDIIDALVAASQAGVRIRLLIRGICCLLPGVAGFTENIEVVSIVGRFLEHSRIYSFGQGDDRKIYISSADMMTRNTERRVEIAVPVADATIAARLAAMLELEFRDNVKARRLGSDGLYVPVAASGERLDSQLALYAEAYRAARNAVAAREEKHAGGLAGLLRRLRRH